MLLEPPPLGNRRLRLARALETTGSAAAFVSPGSDLAYLLGESHASWERLTLLVVRASGEGVLIVPALEREAWSGVDGVEVVAWRDGEDPHALAMELAGGGAVVVSDDLSAAHLVRMRAAARGGLSFGLNESLRAMRSVKDASEVEQLRSAAHALDEVFALMPSLLVPGRTELDVSRAVAGLMVDHGFRRADFVSVAAGESGANPHHLATDRVLARGDIVFIDASGPWGAAGYQADSTRTFCLGTPPPDAIRVNESLIRAYSAARDAVGAGVPAQRLDAIARDSLANDGLAEAFLHRLGHGIGLDVHEAPNLVAGNAQLLEVGMAFSIEPGVYLPGAFGSRIEDIVVVGEHGADVLNRTDRELIVL